MKTLIIILIISGTQSLWPQTGIDTVYKVEVTATPCPIISLYREERYPGAAHDATLGYGIFLRAMWHPGRLLSVGIMSGYLFISSDKLPGDKGTTASLAAIPLQAVVSMQDGPLEIGIGMGSFLLKSTINNGEIARGTRSELAITFFSSYFINVTKNIFIGPELRGSFLGYRGIYSIMPSLNIRFNILRY